MRFNCKNINLVIDFEPWIWYELTEIPRYTPKEKNPLDKAELGNKKDRAKTLSFCISIYRCSALYKKKWLCCFLASCTQFGSSHQYDDSTTRIKFPITAPDVLFLPSKIFVPCFIFPKYSHVLHLNQFVFFGNGFSRIKICDTFFQNFHITFAIKWVCRHFKRNPSFIANLNRENIESCTKRQSHFLAS